MKKIIINEKIFNIIKLIFIIFNMSNIVTKNIDLFLILDKIITTSDHFSNLKYKMIIFEILN